MNEPTGPAPLPSEQPIADLLATLHLAPRQAHKALTLWPLLREAGASPSPAGGCVPLAEALAGGRCVLDEVSDGGSVPHARLENRGDQAVLVLFGEELLGAKQNRIANATFLVAAGTGVVLDVSCVEHGRWSRAQGTRFRSGEQVVSHKLRLKMQRKVARAVEEAGCFAADQGEVWDEVAARVMTSRAESRSGTYQDYTRTRATDLAAVLESFHTVEEQVGFVAAIGDEVVGLECVGSPLLLRALFPKLLRSYAIDAIDAAWLDQADGPRAERDRRLRFAAPEPFLQALARARCKRAPSLGLGQDLRLEGPGVAACALEAGGIAHLTAFVDLGE